MDSYIKLGKKYNNLFESAPVDLEAKKKADKKMWLKVLLAVLFLIVIVVGAYFFVSADANKKGTPEQVVSYAMDFDADVKAILLVENEDAALCVFQNKDDLDYLYVAYLESYENGEYSFGSEYSFLGGEDGVVSLFDAYNKNEDVSVEEVADALHKNEPFTNSFDDYEYFFGSGKRDITVVYKIARSEEQIPSNVNFEEFVYTMENGKEKTYYIYVSNVEKENKIGYSAGIYF